jgi:hypothetical protein
MFQNRHPFGESNVAPFCPLYYFLGKCHGWVFMVFNMFFKIVGFAMTWELALSLARFLASSTIYLLKAFKSIC